MNSIIKTSQFLLLLFALQALERVTSGAKDMLFRKVAVTGYMTSALGPAWLSPTLVHCVSRCCSRYPDECKSVVYNRNSLHCTPGMTISAVGGTYVEGDLFAANTECEDFNGDLIDLFELLLGGLLGQCGLGK